MATIEEVTAETQAIINKLLQQRNMLADEVAQLHGGLALKDLEIAKLKASIPIPEVTPVESEHNDAPVL